MNQRVRAEYEGEFALHLAPLWEVQDGLKVAKRCRHRDISVSPVVIPASAGMTKNIQHLRGKSVKESLIQSEIPAAQGGAAPLLINQVMTQVIDFGAK